ncbi:glycosyl hydrolase family 18 protein [Paraclostridium bifermentans]|nr:glycosyl hydrolase family 18 protein [Paraclostridium bifermentans]
MDWYLCFIDDKTSNNKKLDYKNSNSKNKCRPQINAPSSAIPINPDCPGISRLVGTYVLGDPTNTDAFLLDFVIYAFVEIKPDGTLFVPTPRYLRQLLSLRKDNPDLQVIAAIGGWGQDGFSDAAATPASRYNFARQVNSLIKQYDLDGIDIDWEYPGTSGAGIKSSPLDRENFTLLLTAIRDVIGSENG